MEDKWKVFIKGDNDRGNEAIKLLTDLGANNPNNYYGKNSKLYCQSSSPGAGHLCIAPGSRRKGGHHHF